MSQNIYLLAFGTFGNPYGFRQTFFKSGNENVAKSIKTFDLNTNAIKLFENTTLYAVRKEIPNGLNSIAYSKYSFAKEQNSDRGGTFIGASILFTNEIADDNLIIGKLNEFHKILVDKNVQDKTIVVNHSDNFSVDLPQDFDKLSFNLKSFSEPVNFNMSNSNLVVYSRLDINKLQQNFKKSLELLNSFDTIFFTDSEEIINFTYGKGLYNTLDEEGFDAEIQILRQQKNKQLQLVLNDLENELTELEQNKVESIRILKDNIAQNTILHQENGRKIEDSKKQIQNLEDKCKEFSKKIKEAINYINSDREIEEVKSFHNKNKLEFLSFINQNIKTQSLNNLNNIQSKTNLNSKHSANANSFPSNLGFQNEDPKPKREKKPFKIFRLLSVVFFILWALTLFYFIYFIKIYKIL